MFIDEFLSLVNVHMKRSTPFLLMNENILKSKIKEFEKILDKFDVYYAVKANPDKAVISRIAKSGLGFEIASESELELLLNLGISSKRIISSNPIKTPQFIDRLVQAGISRFVFDSYDELEKISSKLSNAKVILRLAVDNTQSAWPLDEKYGVSVSDANAFLLKAKTLGLDPIGITFHVGSQCIGNEAWQSALQEVYTVWENAASEGIMLTYLNMGGGFPASHGDIVPSVSETFDYILSILKNTFPPSIELAIEPGRGLVGDAGVLVTSIIGRAIREENEWIYLDVGVFNGLMESIGGIEYSYLVTNKTSQGELKSFTVAGPSCDSFDVVSKSVILESPMIGDRLMIFPAGAYTTSYASNFNGMTIPEVVMI